MTEFEHSDGERLSRRQAAERLVDLAYGLTTGGAVELDVDGERLSVPVPDDVTLEAESESRGQRVKLELRLSWLTPDQ
jgi:amphi-Trp domain-containing protein